MLIAVPKSKALNHLVPAFLGLARALNEMQS